MQIMTNVLRTILHITLQVVAFDGSKRAREMRSLVTFTNLSEYYVHYFNCTYEMFPILNVAYSATNASPCDIFQRASR